jgi:hypothetical protein
MLHSIILLVYISQSNKFYIKFLQFSLNLRSCKVEGAFMLYEKLEYDRMFDG